MTCPRRSFSTENRPVSRTTFFLKPLVLQHQFVGESFVLLQPRFAVRSGRGGIAGDVILGKAV